MLESKDNLPWWQEPWLPHLHSLLTSRLTITFHLKQQQWLLSYRDTYLKIYPISLQPGSSTNRQQTVQLCFRSLPHQQLMPMWLDPGWTATLMTSFFLESFSTGLRRAASHTELQLSLGGLQNKMSVPQSESHWLPGCLVIVMMLMEAISIFPIPGGPWKHLADNFSF